MTGRDSDKLKAMRAEIEDMANQYDQDSESFARLIGAMNGLDEAIWGPVYTVTTERGARRYRAWSSEQARHKAQSEGHSVLSVQW